MAEQYAISYADLSAINSALNVVNENIRQTNSGINEVHSRQAKFDSDLSQLAQQFMDFVDADTKQKCLQLAETRVGNLSQELQIKFGYYAEIRRMATGILQAVDTGIVDNQTLKFSTEEVMIKAPGYWLAPTLVSVASWIRDDKDTCSKALKECMKRDDYKATLFFMLVMRRLKRREASMAWLERYFLHQDPQNLDREFIIVLEAVTAGIFHPASRDIMLKHVNDWIDQLTQGDQFINEQKAQWMKFFEASKPASEGGKYPLLKQHSPTWPVLEQVLAESKTHEIFHDHFDSVFSSGAASSGSVEKSLDKILSSLVTNFDDEELPLQREVRLNQLIVEKEGDKDAAKALMDVEENVYKEEIDFLQMLSNTAFNPEASGVTKQTQALAVSISQPWILEAHDTFTAQCRSKFPQKVDVAMKIPIGTFTSTTKDGSDEKERLIELSKDFQSALQEDLQKIPQPTSSYILGGVIGAFGLFILFSSPILGLIVLAIGGFIAWNGYNSHNKAHEKLKTDYAEQEQKAKVVLRGCLAEVVDYRKELAAEDKKAESLRHLLSSITPQNFASVTQETARNII